MTQCKKCGEDNLSWDKLHHENFGNWRLWNDERDLPHDCWKDVKDKKKFEDNDVMSKHDKALWKKEWKPEMDLPTQRLCGICKTICVTVTDCDSCAKFKLNPCDSWCAQCESHPKIIYVERA